VVFIGEDDLYNVSVGNGKETQHDHVDVFFFQFDQVSVTEVRDDLVIDVFVEKSFHHLCYDSMVREQKGQRLTAKVKI
jgi:hypothetical protein